MNIRLRALHAIISMSLLSTLLTLPASVAWGHQDMLVGRQPDGRVVLTKNQIIKTYGHQVEFRGRPNAVALSPDGESAAFLNGAYKAIILIDVPSWTVKQEFDAAGSSASFSGIVYSGDGKKLYASQADGHVMIADVVDVGDHGTLALDERVAMPLSPIPYPGRSDGNSYPGGLALSEDGDKLYVALNRNNTLAVMDVSTRTVVKEIPVGNAPHDIIVHGDKAYLSNRGGRPAEGDDFTRDSSGTPMVAHEQSAYATTGTVSVVDLMAGKEVKTIAVGLHPTAMLLEDGHLYVANTNSDTVSLIDTTTDAVVKTIATQPFPNSPFGSSPNGLALLRGKYLLVCLGRNNALAVYQLPELRYGAFKFKGMIPTAWYPADLAVVPNSERIIVANGKGVGSLGPEETVGPGPTTNKTGKWVHSNLGSASLIKFPKRDELRALTREVIKNNHWGKLAQQRDEPRHNRRPVPLPQRLGEPSLFKHIFYIIKENRTYDQVFGALPQGNGDPSLVQFGSQVTPNHHALAERYVLFDNLYDSGSNSADGHQWVTQSFVVDYLEKSFGGFIRTYPFNGGDSLAYAPSGFLWDNALRYGKSVRVYGEYVNGLRADGEEIGPWVGFLGEGTSDGGTWSDFYKDALILGGKLEGPLHARLEAHSHIPSLEAIINKRYPPYRQNVPDQYRVEVFLEEFERYVHNGNLPDLVIMCLTSDHTEGTQPDYPTPRAMVADNDLALGRVVDAISHSPYWKDSVIFVIEDDAQNGVDHVDGHRTIGFVISPYTKRGVVDSRYYTQIDFVRAMEQILGLPPMNQMDMAVAPTSMRSVFMQRPDFTPFKALPNQIALDELNPPATALSGLTKQWAIASAKLDSSKPDAADENLLNRVIWYATKGFDKPYPRDERVLAPSEVHPCLKARETRRERLATESLELGNHRRSELH
ncbi:MAG: alkaline phosphatase family protein [Gammaproteobacteria bacterium]